MTTKEIAEAVGKNETAVRSWARSIADKIASIADKIAASSLKPWRTRVFPQIAEWEAK